MKINTVLGIILIAIHSFGFGAPDLLPATERTVSFSIETKYDKKKTFQKVVLWSVKTFANSNESIKLKDPEIGVLIAKGNLSCSALKLGNGYGSNQIVEFTLEITVEAKKAEVKITDIVGKSPGSYDDASRPSNKEELEKTKKECLDPYVELIKKELN